MAVRLSELMSSSTTIDDLPDEVLTEVMLCIPTPAALVHAAAASKRWFGIIADRDRKFLDSYRARHKCSPFLGLYIPREFGGLPSFQKADSIQPEDDGDLDLQRAAAKAFSLRGLESHPEWRLLDCYNGRLLLARGDESLVVYNPLSCERILVHLPQDDIFPDHFSACLLRGHADGASSFRVVTLQHRCIRRDRIVRAFEYDSLRKSWKVHHDWEILKNIEGPQHGELMHAGDLIFCKYTGTLLLLLDTRNMKFSVLPVPADNNWKHYDIGEMEDGVCCLVSVESVGISNNSHLRVWKLEKLGWRLEKEKQLEQVLGEHAPGGHLYYKVRKVTNGIALLCWSKHDLHFIIDLKTFRLMGKFEFNKHLSAFPMQMPWPPAFSVATVSGEQPTPSLGSQKNMSINLAAHKGINTLPDHLRCHRSDGKKWRCSGRALPTVSFCEYHYAKANKGKKVPADGEVLAVALLRQKNNRKGRKSINPPPDHLRCHRSDGKKWRCSGRALPTVSFCEYHYAKANKGKKRPVDAALPSPVRTKAGGEIPAPIRRCYHSKNAEPLPVGPVKVIPHAMSITKAVPRTCHRCGLTKAELSANCKNCEKNFCNSCINKWYAGISMKDIKNCCPVCRGLCDCKKCAMHKESPSVDVMWGKHYTRRNHAKASSSSADGPTAGAPAAAEGLVASAAD